MADHYQLGQILLRKRKITPSQLDIALKVRRTSRQRIGQVLTGLGFTTELDIAECLAEQFGFHLVDPLKVTPDAEALGLLNVQLAMAHRVLPLRVNDDCLECAMADPIDFPTTDMIAQLVGRRITVHVAPVSALMDAIVAAYKSPGQSSRRRTVRSAPKPQVDRMAILSQLDAGCGLVAAAENGGKR
jgi:type IV pilus assembly protein PilB